MKKCLAAIAGLFGFLYSVGVKSKTIYQKFSFNINSLARGWNIDRSFILRYGLATLMLGIVLLLKLFLDSKYEDGGLTPPFFLFIVPVVIASWYGGFGAGAYATFISAAVSNYFFLSPRHSFEIALEIHQIYLALFVIEGLVISWFVVHRRWTENSIRHHALHDILTGLPNRFLFEEHFRKLIKVSSQSNSCIGVLFVDLDNFKPVNDEHGHRVGDLLLQAVAGRLKGSVRAEDVVARLSGDEFAVLVKDSHHDQIKSVAQKIVEQLGSQFMIGNRPVKVTASVGVAVYPEHGRDVHTLLRNADAAMYRTKHSGRNNFGFHESEATFS